MASKSIHMRWSDAEERVLREDYGNGVDVEIIARKLSRSAASCQKRAQILGVRFNQDRHARALAESGATQDGFTVRQPEHSRRPIPDIIEDQIRAFQRKKAHHRNKRDGIDVFLEEDGPYALVLFGDPHVDDDGADLEALMYHMEVVANTPYMYAGNIGDLTNNWVGRLGRLFGAQLTTEDEARDLLKWIVEYIPWMFVVLGNHDKWGIAAEMACKAADVVYVSHGAKFRIHCGDSELIVDARHDHPGRSQYLSQFGQVKSNWRGNPAHIVVAGHIHSGGYSLVKNGTSGKTAHCIRLGAFKKFDEYADQLGFSDDCIGPCAVAVVDPSRSEQDPAFIQVFWDIDQGASYLGMMRSQWDALNADGE